MQHTLLQIALGVLGVKYKKISSLILVTILLCTACSSPASQPKKKELELSKEEWEQLTFFVENGYIREMNQCGQSNVDKHSIDISYDKHQFNGAFTGIKVNDGLTIYCEDNQWAYTLDKRDDERIFVIRSKLDSGTTSNAMGIELIKSKEIRIIINESKFKSLL